MSALTDRDVNLQPTSHPSNSEKKSTAEGENKGRDTQQYKQISDKIAQSNGKTSQSYISPSDAILSPATQKLAGFKQKQINKQNGKKPAARTLFARSASSCSSGFDDINSSKEKS